MRSSTTERLRLEPLTADHADAVFAVYSDPATWVHFPEGRPREPSEIISLLELSAECWERHGIGPWAVYERDPPSPGDRLLGTFLGSAGIVMLPAGVWNLGYRLAPSSWGRGLATEVGRAAMRTAREHDPAIPVTARVQSNNPGAIALALRMGMTRQWSGVADWVGGGVRDELYADRPLSRGVLATLVPGSPG